ncbi:MAG: hypothetical protein ACT4N2_02890 [Hyphomicrobium sp.]
MYSGQPKPGVGGPDDFYDIEGFPLGDETFEIDGRNQEVVFKGDFDAAKAATYVDGPPRALINVFTARKTQELNLIDCGIFEDTLEKAAKATIAISCKLIGEK